MLVAAFLCGTMLAAANGQALFSSYNGNGVANGVPGGVTYFNVEGAAWDVTTLETYHWENGKGTPTVGAIHLFNTATGALIGSFPAVGLASGNVKNANWVARLNVLLEPGTYAVRDDSPATWSYNSVSQQHGGGFLYVGGAARTATCSNFHPDLIPFGGDGACGTRAVSLYRPDATPKFSATLDYSAGNPLLTWNSIAKTCSFYGGTLVLVDDQPWYYLYGNNPASHFAHVQCE